MKLELLTIAAFIAAGMHEDVHKLDAARERLETGCFELVQSAVGYSEYIEQLFNAGVAANGGEVPGVMEYEICEPFGVWYVQEALTEAELPRVEWTCDKLIELTLAYFAAGQDDLRDRLNFAVTAIPRPAQPEL